MRADEQLAASRRLLTGAAVVLTAIYPFAIWLGRTRIEPRWLAGLLLLAAALRVHALAASRGARIVAVGALVLAAWTIYANVLFPLKLYPVLASAGLFATFAHSLAVPPSIAERIARMRGASHLATRYARRVTLAWCAFFIINALLALAAALWGSDALWLLYTGVLAYVLAALMLAGEALLRPWLRRRHAPDIDGTRSA